jgi:imidazolonepropionase-like amidohydrolase
MHCAHRFHVRRGLYVLAAAALGASCAYAGHPRVDFVGDAHPSTYRPAAQTDLLIADATILDGAGGRLEHGDVRVHAGRVVALGRALPRAGVAVVDAGGRWLTPGIIDVHSHDGTYVLPLTSIDASASDVAELSDPNAADTWIEHAVNAQDPAFAAALRAGVTTLQILPGSTPLFGGRSVIVKPVRAADVYAMKFPGARPGLKMACGENPKSYFGEKDRAPTSRQGEVALIRAAFLQAQEYRRKWRDYERHAWGEPPERDARMDTLAAVLDGDIAVHMHCYRANDMATMLGVAAEFGFKISAFHHAVEAYKIADQLRATGTCVALWADWWGFKMELIDAIRANAAMIDAGGGCVLMHSDSPILGQHLQIEAAKAAAAGRRLGIEIPPERLIRWVTSTPARVLGLDDRIGTVAAGRNADLVLWSGNPFSIYSKPDLVLIDGAVAYDRSNSQSALDPDILVGRPELRSVP